LLPLRKPLYPFLCPLPSLHPRERESREQRTPVPHHWRARSAWAAILALYTAITGKEPTPEEAARMRAAIAALNAKRWPEEPSDGDLSGSASDGVWGSPIGPMRFASASRGSRRQWRPTTPTPSSRRWGGRTTP